MAYKVNVLHSGSEAAGGAVTPVALLPVHRETGNVTTVCCFFPFEQFALTGIKS